MRDASDSFAVERWVIASVVALSAVIVWRDMYEPVFLPKVTLLALGVVVVGALALYRGVVRGEVYLPSHVLVLAGGAFVVALLVSALTGNPWAAVTGVYGRYTGFVPYVVYFGLFLAVARHFTSDSIRMIVGALVVAGALVAAYALVQVLGWDWLDWGDAFGDTPVSTFGNPNFASGYLGTVAPLFLYVVASARSTEVRAAGAVGLVVVAGAIAAASSLQGVIAAGVGGLAFTLVALSQSERRSVRIAVVSALVLSVGAGALLVAGVFEVGPLQRFGAETGIALRREYWSAAIRMFRDHPVTGIGLDRFPGEYRAYRSEEAAEQAPFTLDVDAPHNVPLEMFAEGGVVLGLAYVTFVVLTGVVALRAVRHDNPRTPLLAAAVAGSWLAYHAQSVVSIDVPALAVLHWVLAGALLVLAGSRLTRVALPWAPPLTRKGRRQPVSLAVRRWALVAAALVVAVGSLLSTRLLRADMARLESREAAGLVGPQAVDEARRAVDLAPWASEYWFEYAVRLGRAGDEEAAGRAFETAVERGAGQLEPLLRAANVAEGLGDERRARALYEEILRVEPRRLEALLPVIRFHVAIGNYDRAAVLADRALDRFEPTPELIQLAALAFDAVGRDEEAKALLERAEAS